MINNAQQVTYILLQIINVIKKLWKCYNFGYYSGVNILGEQFIIGF